MAYINLKNSKLREYLRRTLELNKFQSPFDVLIEEVFVREVYVLDLSPEELLEDINNFKSSIKTMSFGDCKGKKNVMGVTYPSEHRIEYNFSYWQDYMNRFGVEDYCTAFFETVSHECLHGMQNITDSSNKNNNRAGGWNSYLKNRSHAIYEICTQGTAAKIARDRTNYEYFNNIILSGDGYSDEIFAVPLIASTFGVTEKEVLKYGMREREKLVKALNKNIGDEDLTRKYIDQIENQLEYLHSLHYPDDNQKEFKKLSDDEKKKRSTDVIFSLVSICQQAMVSRIQNTPLNFDKNMAIAYKYDQKKITDTLRQELQIYSYNYEMDFINFDYKTRGTTEAYYISNAMQVFNEIGKDETGKFSNMIPDLIESVRTGNFDLCDRVGISGLRIPKEDVTQSLLDSANDFNEKRCHEDYNDFKKWDNFQIFKSIYPNLYIPFVECSKSNLKTWGNIDIYSAEGYEKTTALAIVLVSQREKFGTESKRIILNLFDTPPSEMQGLIQSFTRNNEARYTFSKEFCTDDGKEFLAKLIAEKYVDRAFNSDKSPKEFSRDEQERFQLLFKPTIQRYDRNQLVFAISKVILNNEFDGFENESCRTTLAMIGRKQILDEISQPLFDELLSQRRIVPEKESALRKSVFETDRKYPGSVPKRIAVLIKEYKKDGVLDSTFFTTKGRHEFETKFQSQRDVEDLIGLLADGFSKNIKLDKYGRATGLGSIIQREGKDYFREGMIKYILYGDVTGFLNREDVNYVQNYSVDNILNWLSQPFVSDSIRIGEIKENRNRINAQYCVNPRELGNIANGRRYSSWKRVTDALQNKEKVGEIVQGG